MIISKKQLAEIIKSVQNNNFDKTVELVQEVAHVDYLEAVGICTEVVGA